MWRLRQGLSQNCKLASLCADALEMEANTFQKVGLRSPVRRIIRSAFGNAPFSALCDECRRSLTRTEAHQGGPIRNKGPLQSIIAKSLTQLSGPFVKYTGQVNKLIVHWCPPPQYSLKTSVQPWAIIHQAE